MAQGKMKLNPGYSLSNFPQLNFYLRHYHFYDTTDSTIEAHTHKIRTNALHSGEIGRQIKNHF
jgi:hypothetical protein